MLKQEEKTIDGVTYKVTQLPAKKGHRNLIKLVKMASPAMAGEVNLDTDLSSKESLDSIGAALMALDPDNVESLLEDFAKATIVQTDGDKWPCLWDIFDIHFAGNYAAMYKWAIFALQVNYKSFLAEIGAITGPLLAKAK